MSDLATNDSYQASLYNLIHSTDKGRFDALIKQYRPVVVDHFDDAVEDLFKIEHPFIETNTPEYSKTLARFTKRYFADHHEQECGIWAYFPWRNTLVHLPDSRDYHKLHVSRNRLLITPEEQMQFSEKVIGVAGLSVGSSVTTMLALSGGPGELRLADSDVLSITNLNRIATSVCELGNNKAHIMARRIAEINPFQKTVLFLDGLTEQNIDQFLGTSDSRIDLFIEEMDSIRMKVISRFRAREMGIPVIMATDNGDNAFIDIERFDLEPKRPLFHGAISEDTLRSIPLDLSITEKANLAIKIVGTDITPRTKLSLMKVGSQLPAFPQLGHAAALSGVLAQYTALRILSGKEMPSGRYEVNLDAIFDPTYHEADQKRVRSELTQDFVQGFKLLFGD